MNYLIPHQIIIDDWSLIVLIPFSNYYIILLNIIYFIIDKRKYIWKKKKPIICSFWSDYLHFPNGPKCRMWEYSIY